MDSIIQALSGLMMTSGEPDDPPVRVGVPVADLLAPDLRRRRHSRGAASTRDDRAGPARRRLDARRPDVARRRRALRPARSLRIPQRTGRMVPRLTPFGVYRVGATATWRSARRPSSSRAACSRPSAAPSSTDDPRFATRDARVANVDAMNALHRDVHAHAWTRPSSSPLLERHGVPAAEVRTPRRGRARSARARARRDGAARASARSGDVATSDRHGRADHVLGRRRRASRGRRRRSANTTRSSTASGSATRRERLERAAGRRRHLSRTA